MGAVEKRIAYMEEPGEENTEVVLKMVKERAQELGIRDILVASTWGNTGARPPKSSKASTSSS